MLFSGDLQSFVRCLHDLHISLFPTCPFFFFYHKGSLLHKQDVLFFSITVATFMGNVNGCNRDKHKNRKQKKIYNLIM